MSRDQQQELDFPVPLYMLQSMAATMVGWVSPGTASEGLQRDLAKGDLQPPENKVCIPVGAYEVL